MNTKDKVTEIFCIIDEFDKNLNVELSKNLCLPSYNSNGKRCRNRNGRLSEGEIMTFLGDVLPYLNKCEEKLYQNSSCILYSVQHQCNSTILPQKCLSTNLLTRKEIFIYV